MFSLLSIIDSQGYSCSFGVEATSMYFKYSGETFSTMDYANNIYLIPDLTLSTDTAITYIKNTFYNTTLQIAEPILTIARQKYEIDFINQSNYLSQFEYATATKYAHKSTRAHAASHLLLTQCFAPAHTYTASKTLLMAHAHRYLHTLLHTCSHSASRAHTVPRSLASALSFTLPY